MQRVFILLALFISFLSFSQSNFLPGVYSSSDKKAIKLLEESKKMFMERKDDEAEKLIKKAIEKDPLFIEAYSAYADFLMGKNRIKEAIPLYEKAIQIEPNDTDAHNNKKILLTKLQSIGSYYL